MTFEINTGEKEIGDAKHIFAVGDVHIREYTDSPFEAYLSLHQNSIKNSER